MDKQAAGTVIFDFDGTIADSLSAVLQIIHELSGGQQSHDDISRLRGKPGVRMLRELKVPLWRAYFLVIKARRRMARHIGEIPIIPGMDEAIRSLAKNHTLYVVSSNSAANVHDFLRRLGLDGCFARVYGGVSPWRKSRILRRLVHEHGLIAHNTWYVGDGDLDVRAAHWAGVKAAAVAWGYSNIHVLQRQRPEALVFNSDELLRALREE